MRALEEVTNLPIAMMAPCTFCSMTWQAINSFSRLVSCRTVDTCIALLLVFGCIDAVVRLESQNEWFFQPFNRNTMFHCFQFFDRQRYDYYVCKWSPLSIEHSKTAFGTACVVLNFARRHTKRTLLGNIENTMNHHEENICVTSLFTLGRCRQSRRKRNEISLQMVEGHRRARRAGGLWKSED